MKIAFLINNAYGIGGTIRATANLASALARRHSVQVVSVQRPLDVPALTYGPGVAMTSLIDMRKDTPGYEGDHPMTNEPCTMFRYGRPYNRLHEQRIIDWLTRTDADVVIATRPDLNGFLARDGLPRYLRIGQEHLSLDAYSDELAHHQNQAIAALDAYVTVSEADARQYRNALPQAATTLVCIPNSVPAPAVEPSDLRTRTIVAAGRLIPIKRYDRLIDAFARICDNHPTWTLRLYGRGPQKQALREQIDRLGLYDRVRLMGAVAPIETEWAKGAIAAVSSDMESFGMTIVEAMHCGVPVISTDCPHGPAEIIDHNVNGLLVPLNTGIDGYAAALSSLMSDPILRDRLGTTARKTAATYAPTVLARRYEDLISQLTRQRVHTAITAPAPGRPTLVQRIRNLRHRPRPDTRLTPTRQTASHPPRRPGAFARAQTGGAITVRLDPYTLPPGGLDFVARLRRDPKERQITVPVPDVATAADIHDVTISIHPDQHPLAEGRWDCYVVSRRNGRRHRLACHLAEQTHAVNRQPRTVDASVITTLPYATADGYLAIRAWQRPAHAEVTAITASGTGCYVTAELLMPELKDGLKNASIVAVSRQDESLDFILPIRELNSAQFSFHIPYDELLQRRSTEHDQWNLRLHRGPHAAPVPIGRMAGDIVDRRTTDLIPAQRAPATSRTDHIKPYFTVTNDLAISARSIAD
ncbi:glycosyltransferase family 4 protein [Streptomyces sp. NPDC059349]|uniref:glycosyltransferase family 4 protein n=1 Tax=Streptomyces sp. NPDC059349 TaxID=3346808 RepID=UPI0036D0937F